MRRNSKRSCGGGIGEVAVEEEWEEEK